MSELESPPIKRILVALGLSRYGEGKVGLAATLARALGADVLLLHVLDVPPPPEGEVSPAESHSLAYLNAIATGLRALGLRAHVLLRYGPIVDTIVAEAKAHEADMVVLGLGPRHGLANLIGSSIARGVATHLEVPVVVAPPDPREAELAPGVRSFDEDAGLAGPLAPRYLGLRTVRLNRIVGSVGRARELDESFRPRRPSFAETQRYERVLHAMRAGESLPPVVLYKLGYGYYVLDGNHRIAAAKRLGIVELEAEVTEHVPIQDAQQLRVFDERQAFERATGLTRVGAALPGHYPRLEALVREYAQAEGLADLREAGRLWHANVYRPVAARLRARRLGHCFPDERTADLFVRLADLREAEQARTREAIGWDEALARLCALAEGSPSHEWPG